MDYLHILWDNPDDANGNVGHILEHGLSIEDVEEVIENPTSDSSSKFRSKQIAPELSRRR